MQSLLNQKQSQWAKEMLGNIRLACCVAGGMNLVPKEDDVLEVREGLGLKYKNFVCLWTLLFSQSTVLTRLGPGSIQPPCIAGGMNLVPKED